jgi:phenylacetic acid degradation operon negative regulatory protein
VLLTMLGEYVLPRPDGVWQDTLVTALGALDYKQQAARQAIARSVTAGWLTTERHGRRSRVHLTPESVDMLRSGAERIYGFGEPRPWQGQWLLVVLRVPEQRRDVRHRLRTRLAWAGFGSLGGGLWISPHVERERELLESAVADPEAELLSFRAEIGSLGDPKRVLAATWDLDAVADAYLAFVAGVQRLRPDGPAETFRAQTRLVHEWRRFPFLDPDLPDEVLPARWPRRRAHDLFSERHAAWHEIAQDHFRALEGSSSNSGRSASK